MTRLIRHHVSARGVQSSAWYSDCECYRYDLTRSWDAQGRRLTYIMLNPSTATEVANDPTIERCQRRAEGLGFGAMRICNLFAWRETSPARLKRAQDPVGPQNDRAIREAADWADEVFCAWGAHGAHLGRDRAVTALLARRNVKPFCLGTTRSGAPRHPLYVSYATRPAPWSARRDPA